MGISGSSSRASSMTRSSKLMMLTAAAARTFDPRRAAIVGAVAARALTSITRPMPAGSHLSTSGKRRHPQSLAAEGERAVRRLEAITRVCVAELLQRHRFDRADQVGGALHRLVVHERQLPVGGEVDVQLHRIGPHLDRQAVGLHRVLRGGRIGAAVRDDQCHGASPGGTMAGSSGEYRASCSG